jgi:diguanylate cyclase (GGDEF)-like protein/PAS domain S-box-containing protein
MAQQGMMTRLGLATVDPTKVDRRLPASLPSLSQRKLNALGLPLAYVDYSRRYRFVNKAFLEWTGKAFADVIGHEVEDVVGRDAYPLYEAYVDAALGGEQTGFERQLTVRNRPSIWIRVEYYPDRGTDGEVRGFLESYADVDELKRLELEAGGREHRLRLITDSVGSPIMHFDRNLKLRFANKPFGNWIGVAPDDLLGRSIHQLVAGGTFSEMDEYIERAFDGAKVSFERRERKVTGELRWVRITLFPDRAVGGNVGGVFAVMTDIEDDIAIRDALKAQEVQLRLFADNIPGPVAYLDRASTYSFVNQAFANWVNKPQDQILGRTPFEVLAPDVAAFLRPVLERAQGGEHVEYERVGRTPEGEDRWVHGRVAPDLDLSGRLRGLYCTEFDIHDLKRTEQALAAREEQLRLFTDNIPDPVVYLDTDRRYTFVNEAFLQLNGLARADVIGKSVVEVLGRAASSKLAPYQDRAFAGETISYERELVDAAGRVRWVRGRMVPDHRVDGAIQGVYDVGHDITDLKIAQDALAARESQLRAIMDGVPAPVAYIDREERCRYVNRALVQYFGLDAVKATALRLQDVVGEGIYESAQAMVTRALKGESTAFDRLVPGANGMGRWMNIRIVPDAAPSGEIPGAFVLMSDIHGLKRAQDALRASESELRLIMDNVPARVAYIDRDYRYRFLNRHDEEWLGMSRSELTGRPVGEVVGEERFSQMQPMLERVLNGEVVSVEQMLKQPSGEERWEAVHYAPNRDAEGKVIGIYAVHTDVHDQKRNEDALRHANWMLSSHINNTPLAVLEWDRDFQLVRWSPQAERLFGWRADEVLGMPINGNPLLHDDERGGVALLLKRLMSGEEPRATGQTRNVRKDGATIWCEWHHSCLLDDRGNIVSILSFVQDVSTRIQAEERLHFMATRDALTGLPNRLLLHERLGQAIAQAKRTGRRVGVLFIDLDRFKNVNDTLGHRIGDELLKGVSRALAATLRETDLLARLGGDEFMVIVEDFDDAQVLGQVAQKLLDAVSEPLVIEEHELYVTSSIGISIFPDDSDDPEELLKHADVAMYRSKELGRNTFQFLDADLAQLRLQQHTLERALRNALREGFLRLHYQPIVRATDGAVIGAEALLRWDDPEHGTVSPKVFIALAEESGLIHALGEWVLKSAAEQCAAWRREGLELTVSVNLSARQFHRDDIAPRISEIVKSVNCEPSWIELEVTETSLLHDLDAIKKSLYLLRDQGFTVAIDDFGTGYSSLTHLKHFPIDTLKIDISFIADLETDPGDAAITEAIIGLARGLGLSVVAEGVGTQAQHDFLAVRGCHYYQGYWISPPLSTADFVKFLRATPARPQPELAEEAR